MNCVMTLDQGTTSSRAILFDQNGSIRSSAQQEFPQIYPCPGWVEHDPEQIWESQQQTAKQAMTQAGVHCEDLAAIGIANQRETTLIWNRNTGIPIYNAIVWQDRRTTDDCERWRADGLEALIYEKTGLLLDPYFSATKIGWLLDHIDGARQLADRGELAFGNINSWLLWKMTKGECHCTDISNAARTLLFNIHTKQWDDELLRLFNIPPAILPRLASSSEIYAEVNRFLCTPCVPIAAMAGDQQAALFGQGCFENGSAKNTYGTGCFLLMNTGTKPVESHNHLLTTIGWQRNGQTTYALEGSVFIGGAVVQWLRDELGIIKTAADIESLAGEVADSQGVSFVPAFSGLGAPHWDPHARGLITGLTRGTGRAHLARAALESMCFQSKEVLLAMEKDAGLPIHALQVDGGASANNLLMQIQADLLQIPINRPQMTESTAFGAAALAGLAVGFWNSTDEIASLQHIERTFEPQISADEAAARYAQWLNAVARARSQSGPA
jgi:glycerol kinase